MGVLVPLYKALGMFRDSIKRVRLSICGFCGCYKKGFMPFMPLIKKNCGSIWSL